MEMPCRVNADLNSFYRKQEQGFELPPTEVHDELSNLVDEEIVNISSDYTIEALLSLPAAWADLSTIEPVAPDKFGKAVSVEDALYMARKANDLLWKLNGKMREMLINKAQDNVEFRL